MCVCGFADCVQYSSVKNPSHCLFADVYLTHAVTRLRRYVGKYYSEFCFETLCISGQYGAVMASQ